VYHGTIRDYNLCEKCFNPNTGLDFTMIDDGTSHETSLLPQLDTSHPVLSRFQGRRSARFAQNGEPDQITGQAPCQTNSHSQEDKDPNEICASEPEAQSGMTGGQPQIIPKNSCEDAEFKLSPKTTRSNSSPEPGTPAGFAAAARELDRSFHEHLRSRHGKRTDPALTGIIRRSLEDAEAAKVVAAAFAEFSDDPWVPNAKLTALPIVQAQVTEPISMEIVKPTAMKSIVEANTKAVKELVAQMPRKTAVDEEPKGREESVKRQETSILEDVQEQTWCGPYAPPLWPLPPHAYGHLHGSTPYSEKKPSSSGEPEDQETTCDQSIVSPMDLVSPCATPATNDGGSHQADTTLTNGCDEDNQLIPVPMLPMSTTEAAEFAESTEETGHDHSPTVASQKNDENALVVTPVPDEINKEIKKDDRNGNHDEAGSWNVVAEAENKKSIQADKGLAGSEPTDARSLSRLNKVARGLAVPESDELTSNSVSTTTSIREVPCIVNVASVVSTNKMDRWESQLNQLHDIGFMKDAVSVEIMERLLAENVGYGVEDQDITIGQVIHEIMKQQTQSHSIP
jgi:hypothetical protein